VDDDVVGVFGTEVLRGFLASAQEDLADAVFEEGEVLKGLRFCMIQDGSDLFDHDLRMDYPD
jgi:hypothetical protein